MRSDLSESASELTNSVFFVLIFHFFVTSDVKYRKDSTVTAFDKTFGNSKNAEILYATYYASKTEEKLLNPSFGGDELKLLSN